MQTTFHQKALKFVKTSISAAILFSAFTACQGTESSDGTAATTDAQTEQIATADSAVVKERRPAPDFYFISEDMRDKRVWICDDADKDIFHTVHNCDSLRGCNGKFRNLTIVRAIEDFDRYNCQSCSSDLNDIFDENKVRLETELH
ncbi:hypothetical protein [Pontibacter sp. SGAir0037]|uniref:hypothetical protein n=1 Tax=Pontibacter sp. SGAir0037 TaxID=2571030 RepID=UPI0010CD2736|nr:hypothetical protein [Pontibacter sp. SGAir0037]QCR21279.1 hypothetical protein C1N53_02225 [Pontibacter sp. SGAir0037]